MQIENTPSLTTPGSESRVLGRFYVRKILRIRVSNEDSGLIFVDEIKNNNSALYCTFVCKVHKNKLLLRQK